MRDLTEMIVIENKKFFCDTENIETGEEIMAEEISSPFQFIYKGEVFTAQGTSEGKGRDGDVVELLKVKKES